MWTKEGKSPKTTLTILLSAGPPPRTLTFQGLSRPSDWSTPSPGFRPKPPQQIVIQSDDKRPLKPEEIERIREIIRAILDSDIERLQSSVDGPLGTRDWYWRDVKELCEFEGLVDPPEGFEKEIMSIRLNRGWFALDIPMWKAGPRKSDVLLCLEMSSDEPSKIEFASFYHS